MPSEFRKQLTAFGPEQRFAMATFTTAGTGAPTVNDSWGIESITRTGVGTFDVLVAHVAKHYNVTVGQEFTTTAQVPLITAKNPTTTRIITVKVVGAGGSTAADTTGLTVNLQIALRWTN